jgi:8-oxo-dGTP diphosphatase
MAIFDALDDWPVERRWRQQTQPAPIVVAIIRQAPSEPSGDEKFLLIQRKSQPYAGRWALVGGKWDFGETLDRAIVREAWEETGLETTFTSLQGLVSERLAPADGLNSSAAHFLIFVCLLEPGSGQARERDEGAVGWFTAAEIEELHARQAIIPSDHAMLRRFAGEAGLPHFEVEMIHSATAGQFAAELVRFEQIS